MATTTFQKSTIREYFESIVIAVILALFVRTWIVQAFKIPTGSMENNLLIGDHLLVNKFIFGPTPTSVSEPYSGSVPIFSTARNASCGICTLPTCFMRFLPSFCFSSSLRLREMSPP